MPRRPLVGRARRGGGQEQADGDTPTPAQSWSVDVPGLAEAVPVVRRWVRLLLANDPELAGTVELIAGEYTTNALWHSASGDVGGRIRVGLLCEAGRTTFTVLDAGASAGPGRWGPDHPEDHGRGLAIVAACAAEHGHRDTPDGRLAWAVVDH
ncbi:ATP-binding protein [Actinomadura hibisca]|uniref:ATP-binding protein n=1 Tax=Actinomadura hibisca TaxID=68565 RepID=UPI00082982BA|nr:ATP-binding protein [Actinomadura hibisca]